MVQPLSNKNISYTYNKNSVPSLSFTVCTMSKKYESGENGTEVMLRVWKELILDVSSVSHHGCGSFIPSW